MTLVGAALQTAPGDDVAVDGDDLFNAPVRKYECVAYRIVRHFRRGRGSLANTRGGQDRNGPEKGCNHGRLSMRPYPNTGSRPGAPRSTASATTARNAF